MVDFYNFGVYVFQSIGSLGEFFFETPLSDFSLFSWLFGLTGALNIVPIAFLWEELSEFTLAQAIIGPGLPFILVWKFIKFFVDMVL